MAREYRGDGPREKREPHDPRRRNRILRESTEERIRSLEMERNQLREELGQRTAELRRVREAMESFRESRSERSEASRELHREEIKEAKEDYEQIIRPGLHELKENISRLTDEATRTACSRQIIRISNGIERAIGFGTAAGGTADTQEYTLYIISNYVLLTSTALNAQVQDQAEKELVDQIGDVLKGKLATQIWAVLSKLGRVQQWTVNGDLTVSLFGLVKGNTGLSMTFAR